MVPSIMSFPAIDIDGMIKRLRLNEKGKEFGAQNLPGPESQTFDAVEQTIVNEIENEAKTQYNGYLATQQVYADRAVGAGIQNLAVKLDTTAADAVTDFERQTRLGRDELYALKREVIQTEQELNSFREEHGLKRPPRNYGKRTVKIGFLLLILVFEAVLNGTFLAQGSVFGLLGGILEALIIAGINIVVGCAFGRLIAPWLGYRNWTCRLAAAIGALVFFAIAVGFNLAVAHYRTAVAGDPFEASLLAYRSLISNPIAIQDLQSWALFVIGFIFSMAAAIDGWLMDDPYPGYGVRMRHNLETFNAYNNLKHDLLNDLEDIKQQTEDEMNQIAQDVQDRQREFGSILVRSKSLHSSMEQHFGHLSAAGNTLLAYYRDQNRMHRSAEAPRRFDENWTYASPSIPDLTTTMGDPGALDAIVKQVLAEIPRQRTTLHEAYRASLNKYKEIDDLVSVEPAR